MVKKWKSGCLCLGAWLLAWSPAQAHHSLAGVYDIRSEAEVSGVLTKIAFTNPHGAMHVQVEDEDGSSVEWILTTGSANTLANLGFGNGRESDVVKEGDIVTITYFPARNGKPLGFIRSVTLPDQRRIEFDPE